VPSAYLVKSTVNSRRFAGQIWKESRTIGYGNRPPSEAIWANRMHCWPFGSCH